MKLSAWKQKSVEQRKTGVCSWTTVQIFLSFLFCFYFFEIFDTFIYSLCTGKKRKGGIGICQSLLTVDDWTRVTVVLTCPSDSWITSKRIKWGLKVYCITLCFQFRAFSDQRASGLETGLSGLGLTKSGFRGRPRGPQSSLFLWNFVLFL